MRSPGFVRIMAARGAVSPMLRRNTPRAATRRASPSGKTAITSKNVSVSFKEVRRVRSSRLSWSSLKVLIVSRPYRLLVHSVGDIHQPLHVGAAYFDASGQPANPNTTPGTKFATGGNAINFHSTNLHSYRDSVTVTNAMAAAGLRADLHRQPAAGLADRLLHQRLGREVGQ